MINVTSPTKEDLQVGATYRAKRPKAIQVDFCSVLNDRTIVWIGERQVQFDGPEVKFGRRRPIVAIDRFLTWAGYKLP